jgi:hypothetical protein
MAALSIVRSALERHTAQPQDTPKGKEAKVMEQTLHEATCSLQTPSALDSLCNVFALSPFERDVLLLCAGMELDSTFAQLCVSAQGDPQRAFPTFSLALAALPEAHWSALIPVAPLRRWRLIEVGIGDNRPTVNYN